MTSASPGKLFTPVTFGAFTLSHRVVMPAMNCSQASDTGVPTDRMVRHYGDRATEGGLIICEACAVSARALGRHAAGLHTAEQVNHWHRVTDAVHARGGIVMAQLDHSSHWAGTRAHTETDLDDDALEAALIDYRNAAEHAGDAGFDGVELHAAHGALPARLMRLDSSHRYAGQFLNFLTSTLANIWGADRVGVCLSPPLHEDAGNWLAAYQTLAHNLHHDALAFVHIADLSPTAGSHECDAACQRASHLLRDACPTKLLVSGGFTRSDAMTRVEHGDADAIGFGRAFLANPDLLDRLMKNSALNELDPDNHLVRRHDADPQIPRH
ncbi:hypothetical protein FXN63_02175 [Pigmentiphaga aceris]|uniref:NADH:flavin oxidoreductase/NADH oxidase N-terminal domain-containing protein n=1 Tax=Pigmentiphaga aceris TaxID=1940612 RepID=A0A5C0ARP5_9BURK|nr:hypothetical protein [Pigmentiphaga aceris]QEI04778.1 hypothetical protein FXN63_02175 [Pigmentiphaga aceris]